MQFEIVAILFLLNFLQISAKRVLKKSDDYTIIQQETLFQQEASQDTNSSVELVGDHPKASSAARRVLPKHVPQLPSVTRRTHKRSKPIRRTHEFSKGKSSKHKNESEGITLETPPVLERGSTPVQVEKDISTPSLERGSTPVKVEKDKSTPALDEGSTPLQVEEDDIPDIPQMVYTYAPGENLFNKFMTDDLCSAKSTDSPTLLGGMLKTLIEDFIIGAKKEQIDITIGNLDFWITKGIVCIRDLKIPNPLNSSFSKTKPLLTLKRAKLNIDLQGAALSWWRNKVDKWTGAKQPEEFIIDVEELVLDGLAFREHTKGSETNVDLVNDIFDRTTTTAGGPQIKIHKVFISNTAVTYKRGGAGWTWAVGKPKGLPVQFKDWANKPTVLRFKSLVYLMLRFVCESSIINAYGLLRNARGKVKQSTKSMRNKLFKVKEMLKSKMFSKKAKKRTKQEEQKESNDEEKEADEEGEDDIKITEFSEDDGD
eukprot:gnl/MRDRNA2_/MRDRNA2_71413_c0_seq1.p1 gnl/MRDRNA2_/MRDRNA2_71413_c0~~gnl/MRDRNA2_/MRDRNA2_71413_c0_seq1.p1  ORF type:complete len:514 (+),score=104.79 gnl/MRDRNA2_/MRDRNA2_71413_c0_seq1:93-1544(+)